MVTRSPTGFDRKDCAISQERLGCLFDLFNREVRVMKITITTSSTFVAVAAARMGASICGFVVPPVFMH